MTRAREIARLALATLGQTQTGVPMIEDVSFGFAWLIRDKPPLYQFNAELSDVPGLPSVADRPRIKTLREAGLRWPRLTALGYRVEAAMKAHTVDLAVQYPEKKQMDVLVASHSLCVEMAAYPEFRILKPGEMIRYQLSAMPVMRANIERLPAPALPATNDA